MNPLLTYSNFSLPPKAMPVGVIQYNADIQELPREDTVCQFCGVSYLVHHEVKKLEEQVKDLQKQLTRYKINVTVLYTKSKYVANVIAI